jgi:zinc transporter 1/2/3
LQIHTGAETNSTTPADDLSALSTAAEDACAAAEAEEYDLSLHIASIFIVLVVSGTGLFGTLLLSSFNKKSKNSTTSRLNQALQLLKMFGIGVIASTAWIHLLPEAFAQFANPCLQGEWTRYGTSYVGLFGLIAGFGVQLIEILALGHSKRSLSHGHGHDHDHHDGYSEQYLVNQMEQGAEKKTVNTDNTSNSAETKSIESSSGNSCENHEAASDLHAETRLSFQQAIPSSTGGHTEPTKVPIETHFHADSKHLSVMLLEAGIVFHSVVIGLALGVVPDAEFKTLVFAVCFHQLFEGMALGVLIGDLRLKSFAKFWVLGLIYPLSTPLGVSIGVGIRSTFNENAQGMILLQGILESMS